VVRETGDDLGIFDRLRAKLPFDVGLESDLPDALDVARPGTVTQAVQRVNDCRRIGGDRQGVSFPAHGNLDR
jgi:hypothetical protein